MTLANQEIIKQWRNEPAPLLPILHAFHDRDGYISEEAMQAVSQGLRTPLADLYGTVTFYHHFARDAATPQSVPRVCDGPVCCMRGGGEVLAALAEQGATPMPCAGRCDDPTPVLQGHEVLVGQTVDTLENRPTLLPPPNPGGIEECVFADIREPNRATLSGYQASNGYTALHKALNEMTPATLIQELTDSGLAGRGGAGFPTGRKWQAVRDAEGAQKYIICNADEGEPGCFKDRAIMDYDPHALIEGMILAGHAAGATIGIIYLRYEYPQTEVILEQAIVEANEANILGANILGTDLHFDLYIRRGAGAYICGEETSLLNSLEGKHPFPRNKPPYPVTHGFNNLPTVVNNVETLVSVPQILRKGAAWYQSLGLGERSGTKVISLSGDVQRPGNYEVPFGLPLKTLLYEWAGGPSDGRAIQAVTMAGLSGGFLSGEDMETATLDEPSIRERGSMLGAAGIMVFDDTRDIVDVAHNAMSFFAHESCGKCFPCRIGTQRLTERLNGTGPSNLDDWLQEVEDISFTMQEVSACGLGVAAPLVAKSLVRYFPDEVAAHVKGLEA